MPTTTYRRARIPVSYHIGPARELLPPECCTARDWALWYTEDGKDGARDLVGVYATKGEAEAAIPWNRHCAATA